MGTKKVIAWGTYDRANTSFSAIGIAMGYLGTLLSLGAVWVSIRPMTMLLAPTGKFGQFFGFWELTDKFSGILGPIAFRFLAMFFNYSLTLISLIDFFMAGFFILQKVGVNKVNA